VLREAEVSHEPFPETIGRTLSAVTARDAGSFFEHCGYEPQDHLQFDVLVLRT
jgi:hypothetical protein